MKYLLALLLTATITISGAIPQYKINSADTVLICDSSNAKSYHKEECRGLKKCTHEIKTVTKKEAEELGLNPCKICY